MNALGLKFASLVVLVLVLVLVLDFTIPGLVL
jgi:hypothetical protein